MEWNEDAKKSDDAVRRSSFFAPLRLCVSPIFPRSRAPHLKVAALALLFVFGLPVAAYADRLLLVDGTSIEVDEAWDEADGVWYRRGGMTNFIARARVKAIERKGTEKDAAKSRQVAKLSEAGSATGETVKTSQAADIARPLWIYLVGGARFEVDEVNETGEGVWYKRGNLSIFLERARIERIERESDELTEERETVAAASARAVRRERRWTTGRPHLDALIRQNGARYGVDPYLIFCVMEQESHFNAGAVSPVGARGLMQLMPGTAARFGVQRIHDPAQNIAGGTRFLKQLLGRFNGRVELVLASYNAGEGAVVKYGHRVPPYRETRNYVRRISDRYGRTAHAMSREATVNSKATAGGKATADSMAAAGSKTAAPASGN
ncbi:MAG TPA: lytic transglycosylase domain-containing protein [Pyrinomonadaceae bacterium]|nr:lytic transglycosylase domain-containing protein [Pyrinomonadaceae bacterium]